MTDSRKTDKREMTGSVFAMTLSLFLFWAILSHASHALTAPHWYVSPSGSDRTGTGSYASPFRSIQNAINMAAEGDTVRVMPGEYREHISFRGKDVRVVSQAGPGQTVIAAWDAVSLKKYDGKGSVVAFGTRESPKAVLEGFTIRDGFDGGIYCSDSSPTLRNLMIMDNRAKSGGGIHCKNASPLLENVLIAGNTAENSGGGIWCGGGSSPVLTNVTLADNIAGIHGSAIFIEDGCDLSLKNAIVRNNAIHISEGEDDDRSESSVLSVSYSNIHGGPEGVRGDADGLRWLEGNMDANPLFRDPENRDYHLLGCSLCVAAGTSEGAPSEDLEGNPRPAPADSRPDMGAYEHQPGTADSCTPRTLHVDMGAQGEGDGSPAAPFATITEAIENATPGSAIRVASGAYAEGLTLSRIKGLKLEGGWNRGSGAWTRSTPLDPNFTVVMAFGSPAAVRLDHADSTLLEGFTFIGNGIGVMVGNSANVDIRSNVVRVECQAGSEGIRYAGSSGKIAKNRVHMANTGPVFPDACGIALASGGEVLVENNILYLQGNQITGIREDDADAAPATLLNNEFHANAACPLFFDASAGKRVRKCEQLNDDTLADVPERGGNFCQVLPAYAPCTPPCAESLVVIPTPEDTDGDAMPDNWEISHFGDIAQDGSRDSDEDGLTDSEEYAARTKTDVWDTDGDAMPDGWEVRKGTDPLKDDAGDDPDGDGYGNAEEYEKDSDPQDPENFPFAEDDEITTDTNRTVIADIAGNDGGEWVSLLALTQPENGAAAISGAKSLSYTPEPGFWGTDTFGYTVANSRGNQAKATVTAFVRPDPSEARSLRFDGEDDHLIRETVNGFPSSEITAEFWLRPDAPGSYPLISYATGTSDNAFSVDMNEDSDIRVHMNGILKRVTGLSVREGVWSHIALTWRSSDGEIRLYRNGFPVFSGTFLEGRLLEAGGSLVLGRRRSCVDGCLLSEEAFRGAMDEVRLWNHARSASEIQTHMNRHPDGDEEGLVAYWRFDEGEGQVAFDYSESGNHLRRGSEREADGNDPAFEEDSPLVRNHIHVDWKNQTGTETGEPEAPFRTVGRAIAEASPGTLIRVAKGVYSEGLSIRDINGLRLEGGWNPIGIQWLRDAPPDPNATVIMASPLPQVPAALEVSDAANIAVDGFSLMGKTMGVKAENTSSLGISGNIIHVSGDAGESRGLRLENSGAHISANRVHVIAGAGACGIALDTPAGEVRVENNIIFAQGENPVAISEESPGLAPRSLVNNEFVGNGDLIFYRDADGQGDLARCAALNNGTLDDIPEQGGNFHTLVLSPPCEESPCAELVALPPTRDTDGDRMPDNWEVHYFGDISPDGSGDQDGDGITDLGEYLRKTIPVSWNLRVEMTSREATASGARWSVNSGAEWHDSAETLFLSGARTLTFKPVPGWIAPDDRPLSFGDRDIVSVLAVYMKARVLLDLSQSGCGGGVSIDGEVLSLPREESFVSGDQVSIEAVPDTDCEFAHWLGDVPGADNPMTLTMDADISVEAVFAEKTSHFSPPTPSGTHMDMDGRIFDAWDQPISPGDEIAAFVSDGAGDDLIVGHALYGDEGYAVHIYGDDPETPEKDGALFGDDIFFRTYDQSEGREYALKPLAEDVSWEGGLLKNCDWKHRTGQRIPLHVGWNLISFNVNKCFHVGEKPSCGMIEGVEYEEVDSISDILSSIDGQYSYVRAFDCQGLKTYNLSKWSDMKYMAAGYGYEIKVDDDAAVDENGLVWLELEGEPVGTPRSLSLRPGWNLVGHLGDKAMYAGEEPPSVRFPEHTRMCRIADIGDAFCSLEGRYSFVRGFDNTGVRSYNLTRWSDMRYVGPGYGYWIKVNEGESPSLIWDSSCVSCQE